MEDALALSKEEQSAVMQGLNPCFNGRCTRTAGDNATHDLKNRVLILVLMEDALALFCFKSTNRNKRRVLILVLMEDALARAM